MSAMRVSAQWLCQMVHDAGQRHRTKDRLAAALRTSWLIGRAIGRAYDSFTSELDEMIVRTINKFIDIKKHAGDIVVLLQPARLGSSLPATLIGLHGNNLFHELVKLLLPADVMKNVHLEVTLAVQQFIDLHIHVYEQIIYIGQFRAIDDARTLAFFDRLEALDTYVQKHVDLVTKAAAPQPPVGGPVH